MRRKSRIPVPMRPFVYVAKKAIGDKRKSEVDRKVDARLKKAGIEVPSSERINWRSLVWRRRRDVGTVAVVVVGLIVMWNLIHGFGGIAWGLLFAVAAGFIFWWEKLSDSTNVRLAAGLGVAATFAWLIPPLPLVGDYPTPVRWGALVALAVVAAVLRYHRFKPRPPEPVTVGPVELWETYLSGERQPLAGYEMLRSSLARVLSPSGEDIGFRANIQCPPASEGASALRIARNKIATTYRTTPECIEITLGSDHSFPGIQIIERSVIVDRSAVWTPGGIDLDAGTFELGTYPDGSRSKYQLWTPDGGAWHGWATGGTGSGKSSAVSGLLGRVMSTGHVVLDLVDLGESSLPAWRPVAQWFSTTVDGALAALNRAETVLHARKAAAGRLEWVDRDGVTRVGRSTLPPGPEWPVYWLVIDEWPQLLDNKKAVAIADRIAALGRKYRVAMLVCSQGADIKKAFGGANVLRNNIQQGNIIGLRSDRASGQCAFQGAIEDVQLGSIPPGQPGLGYVLSKASNRSILSRIDWVADDDARPADVPSSFQLAELARPGTLNPVDVAAIYAEATSDAPLRLVRDEPDLRTEIERVLQSADGAMKTADIVARVAELIGVEHERLYKKAAGKLAALHASGDSNVRRVAQGCYEWAA